MKTSTAVTELQLARATITFSGDGEGWFSPWLMRDGPPRFVRCSIDNAPPKLGLEWLSRIRLVDGYGQSEGPDNRHIQWIETNGGTASVVRTLEEGVIADSTAVAVRLHGYPPPTDA